MTIDPREAAASLSDIAAVERRTREAVIYAGSSAMLMLWGVLCAVGYTFQYLEPLQARPAWIAIWALGVAVTAAIRRLRPRPLLGGAGLGLRLFYAELALVGYGALFMLVLWPLGARQISAFWPMLVMLGHVLAGFWIGRFFALLGLAVTALILVGYFWIGAWFPLWMAAVVGGGLFASGWWLRQT